MSTVWKNEIDIGALHHAYCAEGDFETVLEEARDFFETDLFFPTRGNPDFWAERFDVLGIDDCRRIFEMQTRKSFGGGRKVFLLGADSITHEAQNSLLKMFEEPAPGTHFFLVVRSFGNLLPTLKSRLFLLRRIKDEEDSGKDVKKFLEDGIVGRLALVKKMAERLSLGKTTKKDIFKFLNSLEEVLSRELRSGKELGIAKKLELVVNARKYIEDRGCSVKMILENLAVNV